MPIWIKEQPLLAELKKRFRCDWLGYHGINHWSRVQKNGLILAGKEGARKDIVTLFSLFHDSAREDEGYDTGHGIRALPLMDELRGVLFDIDEEGYAEVREAIAGHSEGRCSHPGIHVKVCWDADRLDLYRVGEEPQPRYLCTRSARRQAIIHEAVKRSETTFDFEFPDFRAGGPFSRISAYIRSRLSLPLYLSITQPQQNNKPDG